MRTIVVFSGAGLSQESGIPTFRDANGLWRNYRFEEVASQAGWQRDKRLVLEFYRLRYQAIRAAEPNAAHRAIARLQEQFSVINLTQNIDDLLERAGCRRVAHLHGSVRRKKCEWHRDILPCANADFACEYDTAQTAAVEPGETCPRCGGQLRPGVVWFGEAVDLDYEMLRGLDEELHQNDGALIVVGTSLQVYPAAGMVRLLARAPHKFVIDKAPHPVPGFTALAGPAGEQLPLLAERLLAECQKL